MIVIVFGGHSSGCLYSLSSDCWTWCLDNKNYVTSRVDVTSANSVTATAEEQFSIHAPSQTITQLTKVVFPNEHYIL